MLTKISTKRYLKTSATPDMAEIKALAIATFNGSYGLVKTEETQAG